MALSDSQVEKQVRMLGSKQQLLGVCLQLEAVLCLVREGDRIVGITG